MQEKEHQKNMSVFIIAFRLFLICLISVFLLGFVNVLTVSRIEENNKRAIAEANKYLFPEANRYIKKYFSNLKEEKKQLFYYYSVYNSYDEKIGYIVSSAGEGFNGRIHVLFALDKELKVLNVKLLDNNETLNYSLIANTDAYLEKFKGINTSENPLPITKAMLSPEERDSITGATITFNGISQAISIGVKLIEKEIK